MCSIQMNKFKLFRGILCSNARSIQLSLEYMIQFTATDFLTDVLYRNQFRKCSCLKRTFFLQFKRCIAETNQFQ